MAREMLVNYEYYRVFYHVARYGSLTAAAHALHTGQPNVTRTIGQLEQALGCRLFERSNRGVTLTESGRRLFDRVAIACEQLELGQRDAAGGSQGGTVLLWATDTALRGVLLDRLAAYQRRYPDVRLRIRGGNAPQATVALRRGEADLAVVTEPPLPEGGLQRVPLRRFSDLLIGGPQHREFADRPLGVKELGRFPLILMGQGSGTYEMYSRIYLGQGMVLRPDIEVGSDEIIPALVARGLGIAFVPEFFAGPGLADGSLTLLQPDFALPERSISVLWDPARPPVGAAGKLLRFLEDEPVSDPGLPADPA